MQKLGSEGTCITYDNAAVANVAPTLNADKNLVFYESTDGNIWYYHQDFGRGLDASNNPAKENWFRSPLNTDGTISYVYGNMITGPWSFGKFFYWGADWLGQVPSQALYYIDWVNADNDMQCPEADGGDIAFYKTGHEADNTPADTTLQSSKKPDSKTDSSLNVSVFPNPSFNKFFINVSGLEAETGLGLTIQSTDGRIVYTNFTRAAGSGNFVWDASKINSGVYYYSVKTSTGEILSGRMMKM